MKSVGVKTKITGSYESSDFYIHIVIYFKIHNTILHTVFYMFPNPHQTWHGSQLHGIVLYGIGPAEPPLKYTSLMGDNVI